MPKFAPLVLGSLLLLAGMFGSLLLAGHSPATLFNLPPVLAMLLIPIGCCTIAHGVGGPMTVLRSLVGLRPAGPAEELEGTRAISACIGYVYGAGAFVFLADLLSVLACVTESGPTPGFRGNVAATIVSLLYPVVAAEFVLRPVKHRLAARSVA